MITIRAFERADFSALKDIYQQGIDTGDATFQSRAKDWEEWNDSTLGTCRLVAVDHQQIIGWAALSTVSSRCVYAGVAEASVYVADTARGRGVGQALLSKLVKASESAGLWTLRAGIFPENEASIALFQKNGFRVLGVQDKLGKMQGRWRDVLLLERRSTIVGV